MGIPKSLPFLSCEFKIIQARNVELKPTGNLFVRYYLSSGNNKRVQLNSQEIPSNSNIFWDEFFSLECLGSEDSIDRLKQESIVFELRWRKTMPVFGKLCKSQLLGRAEIPWKVVFESPNMEMERWVMMGSRNDGVLEGGKPPSLQLAMKVRTATMTETEKKKKKKKKRENLDDRCGCKAGDRCSCADYELFALVAAMDAL